MLARVERRLAVVGEGGTGEEDRVAQARTFGGLYCRPNNATLVICGRFDMPAARALVRRYFGIIPPGIASAARVPIACPARTAGDGSEAS